MSAPNFKFSVKTNENNSESLVDMNAVAEIVKLSQDAVNAYNSLEKELDAEKVEPTENNDLKNFIREQITASQNDGQTRHVYVLDENGLANLVIDKVLESQSLDVKCIYEKGQAVSDALKNVNDVVYISENLNGEELQKRAVEYGIKKFEKTLSTSAQCAELAELMNLEKQITGNPVAVFFPHAYTESQAIKLINLRGVLPATAMAKIGGAVAMDAVTNFVGVVTGEKTVKEAATSIATSYGKYVLIDYAGSQLLTTAVGSAVKDAALKTGVQLAANVTNIINSTSIGAGILSGAGVVSGAVATGVGAVTGAVAAAASFAAPIAVPAAVAYGGYKLLKKILS